MEEMCDNPERQQSNLQVQTIIRELKKSFREELEPIHDRLERLEGSQTNTLDEDHAENGSDRTPNQRQNPRQGHVQQVDDNMTNIKGLKHGSRSVEDYFKEMEIAMMRANIEEDREAMMARFLNGLNTEIVNAVELQHYVELDDMVHMAVKIEHQQRKKFSARGNSTPFESFSNPVHAPNNVRKQAPQAPLRIREPCETIKPKPLVADNGRGKQKVGVPERSRDIQCFKCLGRGHVASQCPNRRVMFLRDDGEIESDSEEDVQESPLEDVEDNHLEVAEARITYNLLRSETFEGRPFRWATSYHMGRTDPDAYLPWERFETRKSKRRGLFQGDRDGHDACNTEEDREATMAHFLTGLKIEIDNAVELQHYVEIDKMVHMAIKVER
ncbi:hypothetical protein GQ457_HM001690 [Hibiscus cannabinus]